MDLRLQTADSWFNEVFAKLSSEQQSIAGDAINSHSVTVIDEIQAMMFDRVKANHISKGMPFQSLEECRKSVQIDVKKMIAGDSFFNPQTGIGTLTDPNNWTSSNVPVMFGPTEGSAIYASGGLPATIIDKKTKGLIAGGATFTAFDDEFWDTDKTKELEEAAEKTGLNEALGEVVRDAHLFGGAVLYPIFKHDGVSRFERELDKMNLEKDCIERWLSVDRWNLVYVPSYIVTAEDYMKPKTIYLPLGGYAVSTTRTCLVRPRMVPYWALLYNLGWVPSDYSGWIRSFYGYSMLIQAVPIMAQQMSLLLYQIPLDALIASVGVNGAKELMKINEEEISKWSILHPKAVNMIGEVQTVNRTFSGFEQFVGALKSDLAASCGVPEPVLFHTPNKGFSDNTQEALLKESETTKMLQRAIEPCLKPARDALIAHVYGQASEEYKRKDELFLTFDKPLVSTEKDMAEVGARYAATIASLATAEVPPHIAIELAGQFFKQVEVSEDLMDEVKDAWETAQEREDKQIEMKAMNPMGGPGGGSSKPKPGSTGGHSMASAGTAGNTGRMTKPTKRIRA